MYVTDLHVYVRRGKKIISEVEDKRIWKRERRAGESSHRGGDGGDVQRVRNLIGRQ